MDDANSMEFFRAAKRRTYDLLALCPGERVLDIGCGAGDDVRALADIVGPAGYAVGIDASQTMIDAARRRAADSSVVADFFVGDAEHLDFPDASFDACRADRVLQHLDSLSNAVAQMARVLRPGGRVVVFEPDNGGLMIDAPDNASTTMLNARRRPASSALMKQRDGPHRSPRRRQRGASFAS